VFAAAQHVHGGPHHFGFWDVVLMLISLAVAITGWRLARRVYIEQPQLEAQWIQRWQGFYTLLTHKYYIDEMYDRLIVRPIHALSESLLWRIFDVGVIDRLVNAAARFVSLDSEVLSRVQTGYVRTYALTLVVGALVMLVVLL
jgi:NADH-quinone oxidoreductase subunit L